MIKASTARKVGIVARVVGQQVKKTRTYGAAVKAGRATASHLGGVMSQLWLEVTGFVFLALATIGATAAFHEYMKYEAGKTSLNRVAMAVIFCLMFGWFGLSSFLRVRKKGSQTSHKGN